MMKSNDERKSRIQIVYRKFKSSIFYRVILALVYVALFVGLGFVILNMNVFYIENTEARPLVGENYKYISSADIEEVLVNYIGKRLFLVNIHDVEKDCQGVSPFIDEVYVSKKFPNGLTVRITEKEPAIVLIRTGISSDDLSQGYVLSEDGIVLASCKKYLPLCQSLTICHAESRVNDTDLGTSPYIPYVDDIIKIQAKLKSRGMVPMEFLVPRGEIIVVTFEDATRAIFGTGEDLDVQVSGFLLTRKTLVDQGSPYLEIDMRFDNPFVRVDKYTEWVTE